MEKLFNELSQCVKQLEERIKFLEQLQQCDNCEDIESLHVCHGCGKKLCRKCIQYVETKSYNYDSVVRYFCKVCY